MTLDDLAIILAGSGLGTAAVIGASIKFMKDTARKFIDAQIEQRVKHYYDERIELLKAEQSRLTERLKTQFSWLYDARAKAMLEIYAHIVNAERAKDATLRASTKTQQLEPKPPKNAKAIAESEFQKLVESHRALRKSFEDRRLLFADEDDVELSKNIELLTEFYEHILRVCRRLIDGDVTPIENHTDFADAYRDGSQKLAEYERTKKLIEAKFRRLYGSVLAMEGSTLPDTPQNKS